MRNMHLLVAAAVAGTLLACGQKGPLVLPDAQHPHKKIGVAKPPATPATPATSAPSGAAPSSSSAPSSSGSPSSDKLTPRDAPGAAPQP